MAVGAYGCAPIGHFDTPFALNVLAGSPPLLSPACRSATDAWLRGDYRDSDSRLVRSSRVIQNPHCGIRIGIAWVDNVFYTEIVAI